MRRSLLTIPCCACSVWLAGCGATDGGLGPATEGDRASGSDEVVELFRGVRVNASERWIAFDGEVAIDCHDPETPDVFLEVVCCTPDTREHESLVVARVAPSLVHAALLAVGGEPGRPGRWRVEGGDVVRVPPQGQPVEVRLIAAGSDIPGDPGMWITRGAGGPPLLRAAPDSGWVFAGSRLREWNGRTVYDADGTGTLIGLHTFGSETIAWMRVESPDSSVDEPRWLANNGVVPPMGTPVEVRVRLLD